MQILLYFVVFIGTIAIMEGLAWATHKYVMHGFLWVLHKDHHQRKKGFFEWNDLFAVFFAALAVIFITMGFPELNLYFWIGAGITMYGILYFLVHDIIVHQRVKLFRGWNNRYVRAVRKAHFRHHSKVDREGASCFGFLYVDKKFLK